MPKKRSNPAPPTDNAEKKNQRSTRHFIETYKPQECILKVLYEHRDNIIHYAYILHDLDKKENGQYKEPHWHIVLYLSSSLALTTVQGWFDRHIEYVGNTRNPEPCGDLGLSYAYLTHKFHPSKAHYSPFAIFTDDRAFFEHCLVVSQRKRLYPKDCEGGISQMFDELCAGTPIRDMVAKWGKVFIVNSRTLLSLRDSLMREENSCSYIASLDKTINNLEIQIQCEQAILDGIRQSISNESVKK